MLLDGGGLSPTGTLNVLHGQTAREEMEEMYISLHKHFILFHIFHLRCTPSACSIACAVRASWSALPISLGCLLSRRADLGRTDVFPILVEEPESFKKKDTPILYLCVGVSVCRCVGVSVRPG